MVFSLRRRPGDAETGGVYSGAGAVETLDLWLVRHGESVRSRDGVLAGWSDVPLTTKGEEQARSLRPFLANNHFTNVWSSDLDRALTTARLAWGEPTTDERLREINFGELEGASWVTLDAGHKQALMDFVDFDFPGGESEQAVRRRVHAFVAGLPPGRHLVFTHGGVIRILSRDVGEDDFVPTGTVLGLWWSPKQVLFKRPPDQLLLFHWDI